MKGTTKLVTAALVATGLFAFSGAAMATNGYFTHGVGTDSKGMAGAGVGSPENLGGIAAATNPALAVFADEKWQVGLAIFSPMRSYEARAGFGGQGGAFTLSNGEYDSENEAFPIPYVAKNWKLSNGNSLSFMFYGRGGMNTEWDGNQTFSFEVPNPDDPLGDPIVVSPPGVFAGGTAGVDLMQAFLLVNYAWQVNDNFAIGFGPVFAAQMFEAKGLSLFGGFTQTFADNFIPYYQAAITPCLEGGGDPQLCDLQAQGAAQAQALGDVTNLTNNSHDLSTGYGGAIGLWGGSENFSYGLAYQSKLSMSEFDDYSQLYAEAGGFDIPSTLKLGVSFLATESVRVNLDVEHIAYSDVDSVHNSVMNIVTGCWTANPDPFGAPSPVFASPPTSDGCLGGPTGGGFGWQDMTVYKAGFSWNSDDKNTWRFGFSYGEQPIPQSEVLFNILAPGVMETHLTAGWTSERPNGNVMSFSLMYAPSKEITGQSTFDPLQSVTLEMSQLEFEFAYRF
jgi:long-chain fatty acid transport protein